MKESDGFEEAIKFESATGGEDAKHDTQIRLVIAVLKVARQLALIREEGIGISHLIRASIRRTQPYVLDGTYRTAMHEISRRALRGKAATCTASRAGGASLKYRA